MANWQPQLSSVLREVEEGESVRVISDGHPVAEIVPVSPERSGATMSPPSLIDTGQSGTAIILAEREEER